MNWFLNRQLGTKLLLAFSVVLSLTVALGIFAIAQLANVNETAADVGERLMPSVRSVSEVNTRTGNFRLAEQQHILASGPSEKRKIDKTLADVAAGFDKSQKEYLALVTTPQERKLFDSFSERWKAYMAEHKKVVELSTNGFTEQAKDLSVQKSLEQFESARAVLSQLVDLSVQRVRDSSQRGAQTYDSARSLIIGALACSVFVGLGLAVALARVVSKPLRLAVLIAQTVASGDLSSHIEVTSNDETGKLLAALRDMNKSLGAVVGSVRDGAAGVANSSTRIAAGNTDLNHRSELQASNLQQAAASMEQLTGTVRNNTEAARQATELARSASAVAEQGGKVVRSVVGTMAEISASSRRIADIISVIDGIAFQTNILALNAAVEAARAGEQGRGFSVVAGEVRNLAQRSAVSAKEIKELIKVSAQQVEAGSALVGNAGDTMDKIVSQVSRVTELIAAMNSATAEQGAGIGHVNETVAELDRATQQSLLLVQSSAVVADALQVQAGQLVEAVSAFKLVGGG